MRHDMMKTSDAFLMTLAAMMAGLIVGAVAGATGAMSAFDEWTTKHKDKPPCVTLERVNDQPRRITIENYSDLSHLNEDQAKFIASFIND